MRLPQSIAPFLDHTMLVPSGGFDRVRQLCDEARQGRFACVFVYPLWVPTVREFLAGSGVHTGSVVGFPAGAHQTEIKAAEAERLITDGVEEIDMVAASCLLTDGGYDDYARDIKGVRDVVPKNIIFKVIIEAPLLSDELIARAAIIAAENGADYVKTATGTQGPTTPAHVRLVRTTLQGRAKVKASGGIRTAADTRAMIEAGAERIGTSSAVAIAEEWTRLYGNT